MIASARNHPHQGFDGGGLKVTPYRGTVTAKFSDALVASTRNALLVEEDGRSPVFYFPFEDVYFEFLEKSPLRRELPGKGVATFWSARAVGTSADQAMWSFEEPDGAAVRLVGHGAFDTDSVDVEATPEQDVEHTPHLP